MSPGSSRFKGVRRLALTTLLLLPFTFCRGNEPIRLSPTAEKQGAGEGAVEETPDLDEPAGENPVSSWILVIEAVQAAHGHLGWKAIHVGDTREAVEKTLGRELSPEEWEAPVCGRFFARIDYEGTTMELQFESPETDAALESIFLPISPYRGDKADLVERLKSTLPDFAYAPSIHAPDLAEGDNPTPLYVLPHHPSCAVLLKPEEGIYLSITQCLE